MKYILIFFLTLPLYSDACIKAVDTYKKIKHESKINKTLTLKQCKEITDSMIDMFNYCNYVDREKVMIARKVFIMKSQCGI